MNAIKSLRLKFKSGNDIPVTQATITLDEWEDIQKLIGELLLVPILIKKRVLKIFDEDKK